MRPHAAASLAGLQAGADGTGSTAGKRRRRHTLNLIDSGLPADGETDAADPPRQFDERRCFFPAPRPALFDELAYGFGSIALGVKDNGFSVLLLLFDNQALGLTARSVGPAIMVALIADACIDPFIGNWSSPA